MGLHDKSVQLAAWAQPHSVKARPMAASLSSPLSLSAPVMGPAVSLYWRSHCASGDSNTHTHTHLGWTHAHTCGFSQTRSSNVAGLLKFLEEKSTQVIRLFILRSRSQLTLSNTKSTSITEPNHDTHLTSTHTCNVWQDKRHEKDNSPRIWLTHQQATKDELNNRDLWLNELAKWCIIEIDHTCSR